MDYNFISITNSDFKRESRVLNCKKYGFSLSIIPYSLFLGNGICFRQGFLLHVVLLCVIRNIVKMKKSSKKIWNIITSVLVAAVVILAVLLVGVRIVGLQPYTVLSGSMEPTYHTGSLIYVKSVDPQDIQVGDPITFVLDENLTVATHRVIEIDAANQHFYTKGDANENADSAPVHFENLIGKPVFTIPGLGYFNAFVQEPPGRYLAIAAALIIIALSFVPDLLDEDKKKKKQKE